MRETIAFRMSFLIRIEREEVEEINLKSIG
jgi:hypothetical protein